MHNSSPANLPVACIALVQICKCAVYSLKQMKRHYCNPKGFLIAQVVSAVELQRRPVLATETVPAGTISSNQC